ncbi:MAG: glycosyltransferase family 39 protein [Acidobacteriota bacterium]
MSETSAHCSPDDRGPRFVIAVAAALFLLEWIPTFFGPYGYFIDELYYLACAARPAWGYVDHPPLSIGVLTINRALLGGSLPALRLVPALAGVATVVLSGALARRLGAGAFGQALTALAVALAPIPLIMFGVYSMNAFELLLWTAMLFVLVVMLERNEPRLWLLFGLLAGLGLMNKHTTVLLGGAVAIGVVLSPARRHLATRWPWLGGALAGLILAPNLLWQQAYGWPSLEFYRNADLYKNVPTPPLEALVQQILFYNPGAFPLTVAGLAFLLITRRGRRYRAVGWTCAALLLLMVFSNKSRPDRIAAIYPTLFAAGAVGIEMLARRARLGWIKPASVALILVGGVAFLPLAVPLLPPEVAGRYAAATGVVPQIERGEGKASQLPQWLADRFGWEEFVADVEAVARDLSPEQRSHAVIVVPSYGHAGALELLGSADLPPVMSTQNTYYLWGVELLEQRRVAGGIVVDFDADGLREIYSQVTFAGLHRCTYCMPWRAELPIYRVADPRVPLAELWPRLKHYE